MNMNFDLDTSNYSKQDYYDIFNLDKSLTITKSLVEEKHKTLLNNIENENIDEEQKKEISTFLTECKKNLLEIIKKDSNYKLINSDFVQDMNQSITFNNSHHVIKKDGSDEYHTNKINPLPKNTTSTLLNINTKFRKNFYETSATDFVLDLPEEFKNVVSITVVSVQVPNSNFTFCSSYGTNEFTVELFDLSGNLATTDWDNTVRETKVIKIKEVMIDFKYLFLAMGCFFCAHFLTFFQLNGQFIWKSFQKYEWAVAAAGMILSFFYIWGTKNAVTAFNGLFWPARFVGFGVGMCVYAIMVSYFFNQGITLKTIVSLCLALTLVCIQVLWK